MNDAEIERRLGAMAAPVLPANWKAGILAAARPSRAGIEWIGWPALAVTWLFIAALRLTTPYVTPPEGLAVSHAAMAEHWRQIQRFATAPLPTDESSPARIHLEQEFTLPPRPRS